MIFTTVVVLLGISAYLVGSMFWSIRKERQVRKRWANFGLSIAFCLLFFVSWAAQALVQWGVYRDQQEQHGETATVSGYVIEFGQATLENWQSEFLQLFSFVVLAAMYLHRGSAESRDSDDRMEEALKRIEAKLGTKS